jgi:two-component system NtrC family sensor kinase
MPEKTGLVLTIPEKCRVCYTCVRECPAKAIRIRGGQAEVVLERCIGCGNCVRVCSQHAKKVYDSATVVRGLLERGPGTGNARAPIVACVAPSFPAEFGVADYQSLSGIDHRRLVGMIRRLGFDHVVEVAYGADLIARRYHKLVAEHPNARLIATTCPAIVLYVEKYHPELVPFLAPVVSPMIATARVVHRLYGNDSRVIFIGPCIAKKAEAAAERYRHDVTAALTFIELRQLFDEQGIAPESVQPSEFDPPRPGKGMLFSIQRGILQAADITEDLVAGDVVAADGGTEFGHALREFSDGHLDVRLLEVLSCKGGCIMGAGSSTHAPLFSRRAAVSRYVRGRLAEQEPAAAENVDLSAWFYPDDKSTPIPSQEEIRAILGQMGKVTPADELNCGACGYESCREHAIAIFDGLAESEMCLPATIARLNEAISSLGVSNQQLDNAQQALVQSEKLASMGQLAAGIAHEVNNPLGVVLLYSQLMLEECDPKSDQYADIKKIAEQADRCKKIVSGLLNFARKNQVSLKVVRIDEFLSACARAVVVPQRVKLNTEFRITDPEIELDPDQMMQVFTNLMNNAIEAMPQGGELTVRTEGDTESVQVAISDTGIGIPAETVKKVFEPFFTTKLGGKGTGLGLAICYGIVKMHRGSIVVQSNADPAAGPTGTTMTVKLPRRPKSGMA